MNHLAVGNGCRHNPVNDDLANDGVLEKQGLRTYGDEAFFHARESFSDRQSLPSETDPGRCHW